MSEMKNLLTYEDLAEVLSIPINTIKTWGSSFPDKLPPKMKIGGRNVRFHPDTVNAWLKAKDAQGQKLFGGGRV
jgi:predicted DNA-binding transcriptional regulator AlpA